MSFFCGEISDSIVSDWEKILPECSTNTIFITPWWQSIWWKRFARDQSLVVVSIREGTDILGIIPLIQLDGELTFIGDPEVFDYMDFPVVVGREERFFELLWVEIAKLPWRFLSLKSVPEASPTLVHLVNLARSQGCNVSVSEVDKTPYTILPDNWEDYLLGLRKKDRHELRRKMRRLQSGKEYKQHLATIEGGNGEEIMEEFFRLMALSSDEKSNFLDSSNKRFFIDIAQELSNRGQFKLFYLKINEINVAACICFDYDGKFLLYNSGYDPDYSSLSVGLLNKAFTIDTAIEEGKTEYNFLKGIERYKYHLGAEDRIVYDIEVSR